MTGNQKGGSGSGVTANQQFANNRNIYKDARENVLSNPLFEVTMDGRATYRESGKDVPMEVLNEAINQEAVMLSVQYYGSVNPAAHPPGLGAAPPPFENLDPVKKEKELAGQEATAETAEQEQEKTRGDGIEKRQVDMEEAYKNQRKPDGMSWSEYMPFVWRKKSHGPRPEWVPQKEWDNFHELRAKDQEGRYGNVGGGLRQVKGAFNSIVNATTAHHKKLEERQQRKREILAERSQKSE